MPTVLITAPPATPPKHGLIDSAFPFIPQSERWMLGAEFQTETCGQTPESWAIPCVGANPADTGPVVTDPAAGPDSQVVTPYQLIAPFRCASSFLGSVDHRARAERIVNAGQSKAMEYELWVGGAAGFTALAAAGNPTLTNGATVLNGGTATNARLAMIALLAGAAGHGTGSRGMIHATTATAMAWFTAGCLKEEGGRLVTAVGGHVVVAGTGYTGSGPGDVAEASTDHHWAYLTGPVQYILGDLEISPDGLGDALNRRTNDIEFIARRPVVAFWDGCLHVGVNVDTMAPI